MTVDLDRDALLEFDDDLILDRWERRIVGVGVAVLGRTVPRILEEPDARWRGPTRSGRWRTGSSRSATIGSLCSLAKAISTSRVRDRSRIGLMAFSVGSMEAMETSETNLIVALAGQPWEMVSAPNWWAARTRCLEISGREMAETSGYTPSYMALAFRAFMRIRWRIHHGHRPRELRPHRMPARAA